VRCYRVEAQKTRAFFGGHPFNRAMADDGTSPSAGSDQNPDADVDSDPDATDVDTDDPTADESDPEADVAAYTTDVRGVSGRVRVQWAIRLVVGLAVLAVFARVVLSGLGVPLDPRVPLAGAGVLGLLGLVWVHLRYRAWSYHLREDALYLERGVITQVKTVAPHVRIQHVDTSRSPVERALGLSTLVVYTAGSRGADVSIPGLTPGEAGDLQRRLKELAIESGGGDAL